MSLKKKTTLAKIKMRPGDIVLHKNKEGYSYGYGIVGPIDAWWLLEHTIDVAFAGVGSIHTITDFADLKIVKRREYVKDWWRFCESKEEKDFQVLIKSVVKEK